MSEVEERLGRALDALDQAEYELSRVMIAEALRLRREVGVMRTKVSIMLTEHVENETEDR